MRSRLCLLAFLLAFAAPAFTQQKQTPQTAADAIRRMPADREDYAHWQTDCDTTECTLSTNVLRGASGDPPDRTDHDQYITLSIHLLGHGTKLDDIDLDLPPWAQKDQGLFLAFVTNPPSDPSAPPNLDSAGAIPLSFSTCDDESCKAEVHGGLVPFNASNINLLDKLLHSDHLIVLFFNETISPYRTSISLDSFHQAWDHYLKEQLRAQ